MKIITKKLFTTLKTIIFSLCFSLPSISFADIDAWPFLEVEEGSTTIMYPLHVREDDFEMNFPLYYQTNSGRDVHYLWPVIKISDGKLKRIAPLYFAHDSGDYTLFPFVHKKNGSSYWLIPPMYLGKESTLILPIYYENREENNKRKHFLNYYSMEKPNYHAKGLFPLYMSSTRTNLPEQETSIWTADKTQVLSYTQKRNVLWPLFAKNQVRNENGELLKRKRRFLIFSDEKYEDRSRRFSILGVIVREKIRGSGEYSF